MSPRRPPDPDRPRKKEGKGSGKGPRPSIKAKKGAAAKKPGAAKGRGPRRDFDREAPAAKPRSPRGPGAKTRGDGPPKGRGPRRDFDGEAPAAKSRSPRGPGAKNWVGGPPADDKARGPRRDFDGAGPAAKSRGPRGQGAKNWVGGPPAGAKGRGPRDFEREAPAAKARGSRGPGAKNWDNTKGRGPRRDFDRETPAAKGRGPRAPGAKSWGADFEGPPRGAKGRGPRQAFDGPRGPGAKGRGPRRDFDSAGPGGPGSEFDREAPAKGRSPRGPGAKASGDGPPPSAKGRGPRRESDREAPAAKGRGRDFEGPPSRGPRRAANEAWGDGPPGAKGRGPRRDFDQSGPPRGPRRDFDQSAPPRGPRRDFDPSGPPRGPRRDFDASGPPRGPRRFDEGPPRGPAHEGGDRPPRPRRARPDEVDKRDSMEVYLESQEPWPFSDEPSSERPRRQMRGGGQTEVRVWRDEPHGPRARGVKPPAEPRAAVEPASLPGGSLSLSASCAFGLEAVLTRELRALGIEEIRADNGHVDFQTDALGLCRANLWLRTADRVWLRLGTFPATTFEELFEGTRSLPWSDFLTADAHFPVDGASYQSELSSVPACQSVTKKAIVEHLKAAYKVEWFPENGPDFPIKVSVIKDQATLAVDTSGHGLHKRGYRLLTTGAPMRETLAAGLILLSYWGPERVLLDPFCGSGTIPIEAAMIGTDRAPGLDRDFACRRWPWPGEEAWKQALEEANDRFQRERKLEIFGSDIDPEALRHARANLQRTGIQHVQFETKAVRDLKTSKQYGVLITNPPYGERLSDRPEVDQLYQELGEVVRPLMDTWSIYVLTSHPDFVRHFGQRAARKRKLYNGMIECVYYQYPGPRPPGGD